MSYFDFGKVPVNQILDISRTALVVLERITGTLVISFSTSLDSRTAERFLFPFSPDLMMGVISFPKALFAQVRHTCYQLFVAIVILRFQWKWSVLQ